MSAICSSEYRRSLSSTACARMRVRWGAEDFIIAPSCPRCSAVRGFTNFVGVFIRTILPQNLYPGAYLLILTGREQDGLIAATGLTEPGWALFPACGHTGFSSSHDPHTQLPPPALRAGTTAARETLTPRVVSRRGRSAPRPSPAYTDASVSSRPSLSSLRAAVRAGVSWHAANRNCSTPDTPRAVDVSLPRLCIML